MAGYQSLLGFWMPWGVGAGTTTTSEPWIVDPSIMYQFMKDIESFVPAAQIQSFFVGFKQSN